MMKAKHIWIGGTLLEILFLAAVSFTYLKGAYGWLEHTLLLFIVSTNLLSAIIASIFLVLFFKQKQADTKPSFVLLWLTYLFLAVFVIVTVFHTAAAINYAISPLSRTLF